MYRKHIEILAAAALLSALAALAALPRVTADASAPKLTLLEIGSDSTAFDVTSTLIIGRKEVLLWDAQYHVADARRVADAIAATGKRLKAIIISHPDHDHFSGTAAIVERFPGTPVYMTPIALALYNESGVQSFQSDRSRRPELFADSVIAPQALPSNHLTVDGVAVEVIPDLQGDVLKPSNSVLWIPSLKTVLASDLVFNGVHAWLGSSDAASRQAWRAALKRLAALKPVAVVAGHKKDVASSDTPAVIGQMDRYLSDFDSLRAISATAPDLRNAVLARYPDYAVKNLVGPGARAAFQPAPAK